MAPPLAACIVLLGIHVYLGMHVLQRKVIFVDLALAQIAALGATMGFLLGIDPHGPGSFLFSLGFSVGGAAIFTLTRMRRERVPQEAIIGIVYVVALASAILVADRAPEGAEHIKETLVGSILWVRWPTIVNTALLFSVIGGVHFLFRKRFHQITFEPDQAYAEQRWVRFWDFLFYLTFAFVITTAVAIAGVLLVFSFLVIPAAVAFLYSTRVAPRLIIGWSVGIAACSLGLLASYRLDTPSGPTVVAALGFSLIVAGLVRYIMSAKSKRSAAIKTLALVAATAGLLFVATLLFTRGESLQIAHSHEPDLRVVARQLHDEDRLWDRVVDSCSGNTACAAERLRQVKHWDDVLEHKLAYREPAVREQASEIAAEIGAPRALDLLARAATTEIDPLLRLDQARALIDAGDRRGLSIAVVLLGDDTPALLRDEAHQILLDASGLEFGYEPLIDGAENAEAIALWRDWVTGQK